jgi:hypothetical protein
MLDNANKIVSDKETTQTCAKAQDVLLEDE